MPEVDGVHIKPDMLPQKETQEGSLPIKTIVSFAEKYKFLLNF